MKPAESTVFVVDDEPSVRKAFARLLSTEGYRVETFSSGHDFLQRPPYQGVGCILLDLRMPGASGLEVQQALAAQACGLPLIFVTGHGDVPASVHAMKAGALDFLQKPVSDTELLKSVAHALEVSARQHKRAAEAAEIARRYATLTPRERQVLAGVVAGKLNKQIAADLGTVEKTIKVHRGRVMQKMQAESVADLVRMTANLRRVPEPRPATAESPAHLEKQPQLHHAQAHSEARNSQL